MDVRRVFCEDGLKQSDGPLVVAFQREMLGAFASMDDLSAVTSLGLSRDYAAFFERLAIASAASPAWDTRRGKPKAELRLLKGKFWLLLLARLSL